MVILEKQKAKKYSYLRRGIYDCTTLVLKLKRTARKHNASQSLLYSSIQKNG